jgi:hypothetical protein
MSGFIATPTMRDIQRLEARIDELERKLAEHTHPYRGRSSLGNSIRLDTGAAVVACTDNQPQEDSGD